MYCRVEMQNCQGSSHQLSRELTRHSSAEDRYWTSSWIRESSDLKNPAVPADGGLANVRASTACTRNRRLSAAQAMPVPLPLYINTGVGAHQEARCMAVPSAECVGWFSLCLAV